MDSRPRARLSPVDLNAQRAPPPAGGAKPLSRGAGARAGAAPRPSVAGVMRRGSAYGPPATAKRTDPRPVADKQFMADTVASVTAYLQASGYAATPLTARTLACPTSKDFASITLFLLRRLDPATADFVRLDDDVAAAFRRLRYPFPISKTSLCSVGSTATWPPLLAALGWLADLARYADAARAAAAAPVDPADAHRAAFNAYVAASYRCFMEGDDSGREAVEAETAAAWAEREAASAARVDALTGECSALRARLAGLASAPSPLEEARAAAEGAARDRASFDKLLAQLAAHAASLTAAASDADAEAAAATTAQSEADEEAAVLRGRLKAQTVSTADADRMRADADRLAADRAAAADDRADADARADALTAELTAELDALEAGAVADYNAAAARAALVPSTAKRAGGRHHAASVDRTAPADPVALVGVDVRASVKPVVDRARERAAARGRDLADERASLAGRVEAAERAAAGRAADVASLRADVAAAEARCDAIQAAADADAAALAAEADRLRSAGGPGSAGVSSQSSSSAADAASDAAVAAAEAAAAADAAARDADEADLADALAGALEAALAHKQAVQDAVGRAGDGVAAAREAVGRVGLPAAAVV